MTKQKKTIISNGWYVYILRCNDGTIYTGCTHNLDLRLTQHQDGEVHYTSSKLPVELITYICFNEKIKAFQFEKYLKSGSGRAFAQKRLT